MVPVYVFNAAKLEHSSHSFLTCVTPPISKTAGLIDPTEEAGELAAGDVAGELVDDILGISYAENIRQTQNSGDDD